MVVVSDCSNYIDTCVTVKGKTFFATFMFGEHDHSKRKAI